MNPSLWLDGPYFEPLAWALVHFLWQAAIAAAILSAVLHLIRESSSRYLAGCLCLGIMAICPIATFLLGVAGQEARTVRAQFADASFVSHSPFSTPTHETQPLSARSDEDGALDRANREFAIPLPDGEAPQDPPAPLSKYLLTWAVELWMIGVGLLSLRLLGSWIWVQRMKTASTLPIPPEWTQSLAALARRLKIPRSARILRSALVEVPTLIGWLRPTILLPMGFLTGMTPRQIEAILAHEFAHILRRDYLINLLQTIVETILFYHPAVWWVSRVIRAERENCCDDIALRVCGEPFAYAQALAALEKFRSSERALALAINSGSLLERIRRLAGLSAPRTDRPTLWAIPALILMLMAFALSWSTGWAAPAIHAPAADETSKPLADWGDPMNGLQCRLLALASTVDRESSDLQRTVASYADGEEPTFGIELKNVSDKPLRLAGVRYGDSFGPSSGKWNADSFGPLLFEFQFLDANGIPLARAERSYLRPMLALSGTSVHEVAPGQTLKAVLQPGRFAAPMNERLAAGSYQVRVRYLGVPKNALDELKKHWPNKPIASAWTGPVESNTVAFAIKAAQNPVQVRGREPAWGPETKGLVAAVQFRQKSATGMMQVVESSPFNVAVEPILLVKNVGNETISFVSESWRQDDAVFATDPEGKETQLHGSWYSGWPTMIQWRLKPHEIATLTSSPIAFLDKPESEKELDHPVGKTMVAPKGTYQIRFSMQLGGLQVKDPKENTVIPANKDWAGTLQTGAVPLKIREKEQSDDAQTLRDLPLHPWHVLHLSGKSIGLATKAREERENAADSHPLRVLVEGPGSIQFTMGAPDGPSPATGPKRPSTNTDGASTFGIESTKGMVWDQAGPIRFTGKVKAAFEPKNETEGPAFQMECEDLEIRPGPQAAKTPGQWSARANGPIHWQSKEMQARADRLLLDWGKRSLILEGSKDHPARIVMTKGEGEVMGSFIRISLSERKLQIDSGDVRSEPSTSPPAGSDETLRWIWKGPFTGRVLFVDPKGNPITQGSFIARQARKRELSAEGSIHGAPIAIPDCDAQPLILTVRAPGFEERTFADVAVKPGEIKRIQLTPAASTRLRVNSSVDGKPVHGAKVRFFNKTSDEAGGGPYPMQGIQGPIWQTTNAEGVAALDFLQKIDPDYPNLGNAVYYFYVEPPSANPLGLVGRIAGPIRAGAKTESIELCPGLEVKGEVRGTKEQLDHFAAEWDQPVELKTANPKAAFSYAVSRRLETSRDGDRLFFHLTQLTPGKLRIVGNFDSVVHTVSHTFSRRDAVGSDLEMFTEIKSPSTSVAITPTGLKIGK